jgi:polysaccharide biosynthesis transport protein
MEPERVPSASEYIAALMRRRRLMMMVALPIIVIALLLAVALPNIYLAPAEFQFEASALAQMENARANQEEYEDEFVSKLGEAVMTTENLSLLRKELKLPDATSDIRDNVNVEMVTQRILDPNSGRQKDVNSGFTVAYGAATAAEALRVSQWLANSFIQVSRENRRARAAHTAGFLASEAERYRVQITDLESKLADFKSKHVSELPDSARDNMEQRDRVEQEMDNVQQQVRTLEQNRIFLESQLQQAMVAPDTDAIRDMEAEYRQKLTHYDESHPDMIALRKQIEAARRMGNNRGDDSLAAQLATQKQILEQTRQRYSEDHPDVKRLERTIADLQARIAAGEKTDAGAAVPMDPVTVQLRTQLRGTENQLASLQIRLAELRGKEAAVASQIGSSPQVEKDYAALTRDLGLARDKYDQLNKQRMDADFTAAASMAGSGDEFRMSRAPSLPIKAAKPARLAIGIIGFILGVILALTAALGAEVLDQSVRGSRDVYSLLGVTPLAVVPEIRNSVFRRRRASHWKVLAASLVIGVPTLWFVIHSVVG